VKRVEFYNGSTKLGEDTSAPYTYTWNQVWTENLSLKARLVDNADATQDSTVHSVTTTMGPLPGEWTAEDVGTVNAVGGSSYDSAQTAFYLRGSGANIKDGSDEFHFLHQPFAGNGEIIARINAYDYSNNRAKVGIMLRESTAGNSTFAMVNIRNRDGADIEFARRLTTGANSTRSDDGHNYSPLPIWARLTREGDLFTAYYSENGTDWTEIGNATIAMDAQILAGLCVTARSDGNYARGSFDQVLVTSGGNIPPVIAVDSPSVLPVLLADSSIGMKLETTVTDDEPVTLNWSKVSGPGTVSFSQATSADTEAAFSQEGTYVIRLTADDTVYQTTEDLTVVVGAVTPTTTNLLAHWEINEGSGTSVADQSGNSNTGTTGANWSADGQGVTGQTGDRAASFSNNASHQIQKANVTGLSPVSAFTVSIWVKADATDVNYGIFSARPLSEWAGVSGAASGITLRYDAAGWFTNEAVGGGQPVNVLQASVQIPWPGDITKQLFIESSAGTQVAGQWQHVVLTWEKNARPRIYLNGVEDASAVYGTREGSDNNSIVHNGILDADLVVPSAFVLGRGAMDASGSWDGLLDEFRYYSRALDATEVLELYNDVAFSGNKAPAVDAGADDTVPIGQSVSLSGSAPDPDASGTVITTWEKISGSGTATFGDASSPTSTVSFDAADTYVLRLTATDGDVTVFEEVTLTADSAHQRNESIPDVWEEAYYPNQDTPATVTKNGEQVDIEDVYVWGLDPTDPADVLEGVNPHGTETSFQLDVETVSGRSYALDRCEDLTATPQVWIQVGSELTGDGSTHTLTDSASPDKAVYRIRVWMP